MSITELASDAPSLSRRLAMLEREDLAYLARRVALRCAVPLSKAMRAVDAYKKYVALHMAEPFNAHPMSGLVDEIWHEHILHTREYAQFCSRIIGWFLHHIPSTEDDETTTSEATQARLAQLFGATDPRVWVSMTDQAQTSCGNTGNCADGADSGPALRPAKPSAFRAECGGGCGGGCSDTANPAPLLHRPRASAFKAECGGGCGGGCSDSPAFLDGRTG
jgi:hypothetical protein